MINDEVIAYTATGRAVYDNALTVGCLIVFTKRGIVAVRRGNEPGRGLLGLPGGYQMRGETLEQGACRETLEETGMVVNPNDVTLCSIKTDKYNNNVAIYRTDRCIDIPDSFKLPDEVMGIEYITQDSIIDHQWAFPMHLRAVNDVLFASYRGS